MTRPRRRSSAAHGFALVELVVAMVIVLVLAGGLLSIVAPSQSGFRVQPAAIDVRQRLRTTASSLAEPLLAAGSGPGVLLGGLPLGAIAPCILPYRIGLRRADAPGQYHDDVLTTITPVAAAAPRLVSAFQGASGTVAVDRVAGCPLGRDACGLVAGTSVLLLDASGQADLYGVAAVLAEQVTLQARGAVSGRRYNAGAQLVAVDITTHYLRPSAGRDGPQIARYDGDQSDLPQVDHAVVLSFQYFGDPRPPQPRVPPGPFGERVTYGPPPPTPGEEDDRDTWGAGENCVIALDGGRQVPRLEEWTPADRLVPLGADTLTDGPWCPDSLSPARFDADLLRIRKVRVRVRLEAWADTLRGTDPRFFFRPGTAARRPDVVPDQEVTFDVTPRALGGGR